jgi:Ca2+-binding RTX toxin-like protein
MKNVIRSAHSRSHSLRRLTATAAATVSTGALVAIAGAPGSAAAPFAGEKVTLDQGRLSIQGTPHDDRVGIRLQAGNPSVLQVDLGDDGTADFSFAAADVASIVVDGRPGDDSVRIDEGNGAIAAPATLDGGPGDDMLTGGSAADLIDGGPGNDFVDGGRGADTALLGPGDDTFLWNPGEGSDTVEGQNGTDTMLFNGAGGAEHVDLSANGNRLRFFRDVATVTMDTDGIERVDFNALGGADLVTVHDLSATDVREVNVDLAGTLGGGAGDGSADQVVVEGTNGRDAISVGGDAGDVHVAGLAATVDVRHAEVANDRLDVDTEAGIDTVDSAGLAAGAIQLFVDGALVS